MAAALPNILFLTIDGLRYDRLGCSGYSAAHSPTIDRLAAEGVFLSNYHCHGSPTQFSFPSIFASTYPLDEGGYGLGIRDRAASFVEVLQQAGYWTVGLSLGGALTAAHGYHRGFSVYHHLNDITVPLSTMWKNELAFYRTLYRDGRITLDDLVDATAGAVELALISTIRSCQEKQEELRTGSVAVTAAFHGGDFPAIAEAMEAELVRFRQDPGAYLQELVRFSSAEEAFPVLPLPRVSRNRTLGRLHDYANQILKRFDVKLRFGRQKHMGAASVFDSVDRYLDRAEGKPFFIWGHVIDVHDLCFGDGRVFVPPLMGSGFWKIRKHGRSYRGLRSYDYAVSYVDRLIGRLMEGLRRRGLDRNTLVVVTSDHGLAANWPRPKINHVANFYEEHCHVPLILWGDGLSPRRIDALTGSVDLSATLLGLLGLENPPSFKGRDFLAEGAVGRPYVLMENLGRGPYDLARKAIRLAFRTPDRKYILEETGDGCSVVEVYDLISDPDEKSNLVALPEEQDGIARMARLGAERCRDVRKVC